MAVVIEEAEGGSLEVAVARKVLMVRLNSAVSMAAGGELINLQALVC